jgi:hypothetical protein
MVKFKPRLKKRKPKRKIDSNKNCKESTMNKLQLNSTQLRKNKEPSTRERDQLKMLKKEEIHY